MKLSSLLLLQAAAAVSGSVLPSFLLPRAQAPCPFHTPAANAAPSQYIVKLRKGHNLQDHFKHIGKNLQADAEEFDDIPLINAYRAKLDEATVHDLIRHDPKVEYVEQDHYIYTPDSPSQDPPEEWKHQDLKVRDHTLERRQLAQNFYVTSEESQWWHAYITQGRTVNALNRNWEPTAYNFEGAGAGVDIYIMDSGVRLNHTWFQGRATNFGNSINSSYTGGPADDFDSHGTHVASIAARVAPAARIVNVKITCKRVFDDKNKEPNCKEGLGGGALRALSDIAAAHKKNKGQQGFQGSVINISFGMQVSFAIAEAIQEATTQAGIPISVAAGNTNTDQVMAPCVYNKNTVCVGAVDRKYKRFAVSNYGKKLGIMAPGEYITAAGINGDTDNTAIKSGTSQASPMVAGTMALFVGYEGLNNNVKAVYSRLANNSLPNAVTGFDSNTINLFLNTGISNQNKSWMEPYAGVPDGILFGGIPGVGKQAKVESEANDSIDTETVGGAVAAGAAAAGAAAGASAAAAAATSNEPAAPTGDPNATGSGAEPVSDVQVPKGYKSLGIASGGPSAAPTVTISWTAPDSEPTTTSSIDNPSTIVDIWTLNASGGAAATSTTSTPPTSTTSQAAPPPPLESCHTQYDLFFDAIDIYGFDWDQSKLDAGGGKNSGNGLLTQLRGCSVISDWSFTPLTVDAKNPYQWHAYGRSTIWQKNCIEHAMSSAGSPSEACDGSG